MNISKSIRFICRKSKSIQKKRGDEHGPLKKEAAKLLQQSGGSLRFGKHSLIKSIRFICRKSKSIQKKRGDEHGPLKKEAAKLLQQSGGSLRFGKHSLICYSV